MCLWSESMALIRLGLGQCCLRGSGWWSLLLGLYRQQLVLSELLTPVCLSITLKFWWCQTQTVHLHMEPSGYWSQIIHLSSVKIFSDIQLITEVTFWSPVNCFIDPNSKQSIRTVCVAQKWNINIRIDRFESINRVWLGLFVKMCLKTKRQPRKRPRRDHRATRTKPEPPTWTVNSLRSGQNLSVGLVQVCCCQ